MSQPSEMLEKVLHALYPGIIFDTEGLVSLLLPCVAIVLLGLIFSLLMKFSRLSRRSSFLPVVIALIVAIVASSFFPVSLMHIGQGIMNQLQQTMAAQGAAL